MIQWGPYQTIGGIPTRLGVEYTINGTKVKANFYIQRRTESPALYMKVPDELPPPPEPPVIRYHKRPLTLFERIFKR